MRNVSFSARGISFFCLAYFILFLGYFISILFPTLGYSISISYLALGYSISISYLALGNFISLPEKFHIHFIPCLVQFHIHFIPCPGLFHTTLMNYSLLAMHDFLLISFWPLSTLHSHCLSNGLCRTFVRPCHFRWTQQTARWKSIGIRWTWLDSAASPGKVWWKSTQTT